MRPALGPPALRAPCRKLRPFPRLRLCVLFMCHARSLRSLAMWLRPCHAVSMLRPTPPQVEEYKAGCNRNPAALRGARPSARPRSCRRPAAARRRVSVVGSPVVGVPASFRGSGLSLALCAPWAFAPFSAGLWRSGRLSPALASRRLGPACDRRLAPRPALRLASRPSPRPAAVSLLRSPLRPAPLGARVRWLAIALGARWGGPPSPLRDLQT